MTLQNRSMELHKRTGTDTLCRRETLQSQRRSVPLPVYTYRSYPCHHLLHFNYRHTKAAFIRHAASERFDFRVGPEKLLHPFLKCTGPFAMNDFHFIIVGSKHLIQISVQFIQSLLISFSAEIELPFDRRFSYPSCNRAFLFLLFTLLQLIEPDSHLDDSHLHSGFLAFHSKYFTLLTI